MAGSTRPVVVLRTSPASDAHVKTLARWVRAMLPAALLVIAPLGAPVSHLPGDVIALDVQDVQDVDSGPLSVADALVRAVSRRADS
jgi:hypothetical protein